MDDIASSGHGPFPKGDPAGTKIGRFCRGPVLRFDWPKPQDLKPLVLASLVPVHKHLFLLASRAAFIAKGERFATPF